MKLLVSIIALIGLSGCWESGPTLDFSTPEGAILMLEDAYRKKDIEAAVAAKDFTMEARVMLTKVGDGGLHANEEVLKQTVEVLELAFRAEMKHGFPDFTGLTSHFPEKEKYAGFNNVVVVTEVCVFPDGGISRQRLLVAKTERGWRVLNVLE